MTNNKIYACKTQRLIIIMTSALGPAIKAVRDHLIKAVVSTQRVLRQFTKWSQWSTIEVMSMIVIFKNLRMICDENSLNFWPMIYNLHFLEQVWLIIPWPKTITLLLSLFVLQQCHVLCFSSSTLETRVWKHVSQRRDWEQKNICSSTCKAEMYKQWFG